MSLNSPWHVCMHGLWETPSGIPSYQSLKVVSEMTCALSAKSNSIDYIFLDITLKELTAINRGKVSDLMDDQSIVLELAKLPSCDARRLKMIGALGALRSSLTDKQLEGNDHSLLSVYFDQLENYQVDCRRSYERVIDLIVAATNLKYFEACSPEQCQQHIHSLLFQADRVQDAFLAIRARATLLRMLSRLPRRCVSRAQLMELIEALFLHVEKSMETLKNRPADIIHSGDDFLFFGLSLVFCALQHVPKEIYANYLEKFLPLYHQTYSQLPPLSKSSMATFYMMAKRAIGDDVFDKHQLCCMFEELQHGFIHSQALETTPAFLRAAYLVNMANDFGVLDKLDPQISNVIISRVNQVATPNYSLLDQKYDSDSVVLAYAMFAWAASGSEQLWTAMDDAFKRLSSHANACDLNDAWVVINACLHVLFMNSEGEVEH